MTEEVTTNIIEMKCGAEETGTSAAEVLKAAESPFQEASDVRSKVDHFLGDIKTA